MQISGDILGAEWHQAVGKHAVGFGRALPGLASRFSSPPSETQQDREAADVVWDGFVEIYSQQRRSIFHPWPYLKTVFGLAALGAAGLVSLQAPLESSRQPSRCCAFLIKSACLFDWLTSLCVCQAPSVSLLDDHQEAQLRYSLSWA
ncbi:hypothetical protein SRHO_G00276460 [Serrasalmus rhombeus]